MFFNKDQPVIGNREIKKKIKENIFPILKDAGFSEFSPTMAWRYADEYADVIEFQLMGKSIAEQIGVTPFSLAVNLGKYIAWCPADVPEKLLYQKDNLLTPHVAACPARKSLNRSVFYQKPKNKKVWPVLENGKNLEEVIADIANTLSAEGLGWLDSLEDIAVWEAMLLEQEQTNDVHGFGDLDSPLRNLLLGHTQIKKQDWNRAIDSYQKTLESNAIYFSKDLIEDRMALAQSKLK